VYIKLRLGAYVIASQLIWPTVIAFLSKKHLIFFKLLFRQFDIICIVVCQVCDGLIQLGAFSVEDSYKQRIN
jgi:hypothetical protein